MNLHRDLIALANDFGADPEYARAGGGNASVKHDGVLYIKPSGVTLATLKDEDLVPLRVDVLLDALHSDEPVEGDPVRVAAQAAQLGDAGGRRPSVEILFHALIPDALVLHLHPLAANAVTCNEDGARLTRELLGDDAVWVDYIDPGVPLARRVEAARDAHARRTGRPAPGVVLLGNHGIIVSGASYAEVAERTRWLTAKIEAAIGESEAPDVPPRDLAGLAESFRRAIASEAVAVSVDGVAATASDASAGPVGRGPLIPDQIVYAGSFPVLLGEGDDASTVAERVAAFEAEHGRAPIVGVVPGVGVLAGGATQGAADNALATYLDALRVARDADRIGRVRVMTERERGFIENWEAEAYRKQINAGG